MAELQQGAAARAAGSGGSVGTLRPGPLQRHSKAVTATEKVPHQTNINMEKAAKWKARAAVP